MRRHNLRGTLRPDKDGTAIGGHGSGGSNLPIHPGRDRVGPLDGPSSGSTPDKTWICARVRSGDNMVLSGGPIAGEASMLFVKLFVQATPRLAVSLTTEEQSRLLISTEKPPTSALPALLIVRMLLVLPEILPPSVEISVEQPLIGQRRQAGGRHAENRRASRTQHLADGCATIKGGPSLAVEDIRGFSWLTQQKSVEKLKKREELLGWKWWRASGFLWLTESDLGSHRFAPDFATLPLRSAGRRFLVGRGGRFLGGWRHEHGH